MKRIPAREKKRAFEGLSELVAGARDHDAIGLSGTSTGAGAGARLCPA
jgi:hypothetical protein